MARADLNLNDFLTMNRQIRKMGGVGKLISALPGGDKAMASGQVDMNALDHMEVIINSMTKAEREKPDLLNGSRRARIAHGAGVRLRSEPADQKVQRDAQDDEEDDACHGSDERRR